MGKWRLKTKLRSTRSGRWRRSARAASGSVPFSRTWVPAGRSSNRALADDLRVQPVGCCLQCGHVVDGQEGVVVLTEADVGSLQVLFDERVAIEPVAGVKRKEGSH